MINYLGIKGLTSNSIFSYLLFSQTDYENTYTSDNNPTFYINAEQNTNNLLLKNISSSNAVINFGHLLTSNVTNNLNPNTNTFFNFRNFAALTQESNSNILALNCDFHFIQNVTISGEANLHNINFDLFTWNGVEDKYFNITDGSIDSNCPIATKSYVEALYFNTTSDKRAKENINAVKLSAIDIVKNIPVYSFTYKDTQKQSIGIMAQDIQDISIDGFKLVDNINADGVNGNYMQVVESKLVYVLWKAVQEQQQEIEQLKSQLGGK